MCSIWKPREKEKCTTFGSAVPQQGTTEQPSNYPRVMGIQKTRTKYQNSQQQDSLKRSPRTKVLGWAILLEAS